MKIVFIGETNSYKNDKKIKDLKYLGQEITLCSSNIFTLLSIPFKHRTGDIYFYCGGRFLGLVMGVCEKLLVKPVLNINMMPKGDAYVFEKKCYKEYARYFKYKQVCF